MAPNPKSNDESTENALHCARAALGMMERRSVAPHPHNFAVWYTYVADRLPPLSAAIDNILSAGKGFTAEVSADLYQRFFAAPPEDAELNSVRTSIEGAVSKVQGYLATANQGVTGYGDALQTFSGELDRAPPAADLGGLVHTIIEETETMKAVNRQLEDRLAAASREIERLREDLGQLRREATIDHLTGLANRKLFEITLREAIALAEANGSPLSLLMIDVDFFKLFNDAHGHPMGDQVLRLLGRTLAECIKTNDTACRYGGEEFVVVLPETTLDDAASVAETIRSTMAGKTVTNRQTGKPLGHVTLSVGAAQYVAGEDKVVLVQRADEALYLAKRNGRNRVMSERDLAAQ